MNQCRVVWMSAWDGWNQSFNPNIPATLYALFNILYTAKIFKNFSNVKSADSMPPIFKFLNSLNSKNEFNS